MSSPLPDSVIYAVFKSGPPKVTLAIHGAIVPLVFAISSGVTVPAAMAQNTPPAAGSKDQVLPAVKVEAQQSPPDANPYADPAAPYKADSLSGSKFTEPILDTARSVTVGRPPSTRSAGAGSS